MAQVFLNLPEDMHAGLWAHLLPDQSLLEEVAFLYARAELNDEAVWFQTIEWRAVPPNGFVYQTEIGFEITDEVRASVIKHAHDLRASLIELHSHTGTWPAKFSPSDLYGFREFVPHIWWRLKGRPYAATVVTRSGFDGLAWVIDADSPQRLDGIIVGERLFKPTGLSPLVDDFYYE